MGRLFACIAVGAGISTVTVFVIIITLFMYTLMTSDSEEEQQAEFVERYNSIETEKQADFTGRLNSTVVTADVKNVVLGSARPVFVGLTFRATLKEVFVDFEADKALNAKRAEEESQAVSKEGRGPVELKPLTIDEIYASSKMQAEAMEQLPPEVKDAMQIFADGVVEIDLAGLGFSAPPNLGWFMGPGHIGVSARGYAQVCSNVPANDSEKYIATFTLHADREREDSWKKEVLFSGTAKELCSKRSSYPKYYEEKGVVVFQRPAVALLPTPTGIVPLGSSRGLEPGQMLYFPRITATGGMKVGIGFFEGVRKFGLKTEVIEFNSAVNPAIDVGSPVYYVSGGNQVKLIGFVLPDGTVVYADFVLTGLAE